SAVLRVPPARVLRREAEPLPRHRWVSVATVLTLVVGVWGMAAFQYGSPRLGLPFTGGVALVAAALAAAAFLVSWGVRRLPRDLFSLRPWLRHGIAALARPGAAASGAIVALGLGVLVVLGMSLVERRITGQLEKALPTNAPSAFLVDIQPAQWPGVESLLEQQGARGIESVPVVMARLAAIDGVPVEKLQAQEGTPEGGQRQEGPEGGRRRERWALT